MISRAGRILRPLAGEREGLSLSAIADRVELRPSTVPRIVTALETDALVARASPGGRYRLGPELNRLASQQHAELRIEVGPRLDGLSKLVSETVDLSTLAGEHVAFVDQIAAPHRLRAVSAIGTSFPAHCTARRSSPSSAMSSSKTCSHTSCNHSLRTRSRPEPRCSGRWQSRHDGFAIDREEHTLGISAIGAAVHDRFGAVAAVSIPVPTQRFDGNEASLARALLKSCAEISRLLGAA